MNEAYREAGRMYRAGERDVCTPADVAELLPVLDTCMTSLDGLCTLLREGGILDQRNLVTFFSQRPFDTLAIMLLTDYPVLRTDAYVHDALAKFVHADGVDAARVACGLSVPVIRALAAERTSDVPAVHDCLRLVHWMTCVSRGVIVDVSLFRNMARFAATSARIRAQIVAIVAAGDFFASTPLVEDLFVQLVRVCARTRAHASDTVEHLERLVERNPELRDARFVDEVAELWRTGWPPSLGALLAHLLDTPCVALVVRLAAVGRLDDLVAIAFDRTDAPWRAVRGHLRTVWPARVGDVAGDAPASEVVCPITLHAPRVPVVLSDGHTYERDAILTHLATHGFVSPVTRQRVSTHVFANRAVS